MAGGKVLVARDGAIATVTLSSPRGMNALAKAMWAPLVARWHKKFVRRLLDPRPLSAEERDEGHACFDTEDFRTRVAAFLAKKEPDFQGR